MKEIREENRKTCIEKNLIYFLNLPRKNFITGQYFRI